MRPTTYKENNENQPPGAMRNSNSAVRGVSWDKSRNRWTVGVGHNGKVVRVGRFKTIEEAAAAAVAKRLELFTHNDADRAATMGS